MGRVFGKNIACIIDAHAVIVWEISELNGRASNNGINANHFLEQMQEISLTKHEKATNFDRTRVPTHWNGRISVKQWGKLELLPAFPSMGEVYDTVKLLK